MKINTINLQNFKNYSELSVELSSQINLITGLNGSGKTNLLDAIHYLAFTKSAFQSMDSKNLKVETPYFLIQGQFDSGNNQFEVTCYFDIKQKKTVRLDT